MAKRFRKWTSFLAAAGLAGTAAAQDLPASRPESVIVPTQLIRHRPAPYCPPGQVAPWPGQSPSTTPTQPSDPSQPLSPAQSSPGAENDSMTNFQVGSISAAGTGISAAAQGQGGATVVGFPQVPLLLPGLLTAASAQSARPMDVVSFSYAYLDGFQVFQSQLNTGLPLGTSNRVRGFNLNTYTVGIEKTLFDGNASIYARVPYLNATSNNTGQAIDGLGNVSFGAKVILFGDSENRNLLTGGFTVDAPTGRDVQYPTTISNATISPDGRFVTTPGATATFTRINPTFLQPWLAGQIGGERLFIHNYFGVLIPTDNQVATFINDDLTVGYTIFRSCSNGVISSVTPIASFQALIPINHRGEPNSIPAGPAGTVDQNTPPTFGFSDQFFVSGGAQVGLGERALLSFSVVTPVAGPRAFNIGYNVGLSYRY